MTGHRSLKEKFIAFSVSSVTSVAQNTTIETLEREDFFLDLFHPIFMVMTQSSSRQYSMSTFFHTEEKLAHRETLYATIMTKKKRAVVTLCFCCMILFILLLFFTMQPTLSPVDESLASLAVQEPRMDITSAFEKLSSQFHLPAEDSAIIIDISEQTLALIQNGDIVKSYPISSSAYGIGNQAGSNKTPAGTHIISHKIGDGAEKGAIFKARRNTGKIAKIYTERVDVDEDLVTTRIMWLQGMESGINKGKGIDSHARYIYIHGTSEEGLIGEPASHGCIRMKNQDVIELFDLAEEGMFVEIQE